MKILFLMLPVVYLAGQRISVPASVAVYEFYASVVQGGGQRVVLDAGIFYVCCNRAARCTYSGRTAKMDATHRGCMDGLPSLYGDSARCV